MTNFGNKLGSSVKRLGVKIERGGRRLGHRIYNDMGKNQAGFRKADNTLNVVSKIGKFIPIVGTGLAVASGGAYVGNNIAKKSKKNMIEKYNSRKAKEEQVSKSEALKPGFF